MTTEPQKKKMIQQIFHPSLFVKESVNSEIMEDEINDESSEHPQWQRVPVLRTNKKRKFAESPSPPANTSNRYLTLPLDAAEGELPKRENKPPPLLLYGVEDVNKLVSTIESVLKKTDYAIKIVSKNQLRVTCNSIDAYKTLMVLVREQNMIGHTFTPKAERCYRIVIKNLHHTTPIEAIKEAIENTGNIVRGEIINARVGPNKRPSTTFFVNLEPSTKNKEAKNIKYIFHTAVKIEDPIKRSTVVQCMRCQQYGHTKNNCLKPYRCVRCAESHKTSDCPNKDKNTPAKCALCLGTHPANYKGCEVYQQIHKRKATRAKTVPIYQQSTSNNDKKVEEQVLNIELSPKPGNTNTKTFAEATKGKDTNKPNETEPTIIMQKLLIEQTKKMDILLEQITSLVGLMSTLITKFIK